MLVLLISLVWLVVLATIMSEVLDMIGCIIDFSSTVVCAPAVGGNLDLWGRDEGAAANHVHSYEASYAS